MPDAMDAVQQLAADPAADALAQHARRPVHAGRETCANLDCGGGIAPARTALGAQLCIECQQDAECEASRYNKRGRR